MATPTYIPSVRARRLARILKDSRETAGLSQTSVAGRFGWSQQKLSYIESARNKVSEQDVANLLDVYGVESPDRDAVLTLAREADQRNWWTDFTGILTGPYVALEDEASEIIEWAPYIVPGLLQTADYARALMATTEVSDLEFEQKLRARMARQTVLSRNPAPRLHVILDEAVLERPIGGPEVLQGQLLRLLAEAERPTVTIQILPKAVGAHPGVDGPCILLRFASDLDPDVAYVEGFMGGAYLEQPRKVTCCRVALERLHKIALPPDESAALIRAAAHP
ncbi:helix-turn-helix transcriptional regulator [Actinocorallia sp. A-T 12471]|uniref:helix-turn-helix domain-containing protein n=1 Tax=Actinocorallia sp. A-T 12471 TaxID=3089813 RepID=UPI0029D0681E|nr:helix-turn-helix transcriptional regulator [Actinocorallia sp. A-T 12471]MDX6741728.1 helix-turn-helix transcriptional regulator [Actinocorallia sp. A-T 12471]